MSKVTIVSALYYIGRDRWKASGFGLNNDRYKNWVKNLLSLDTNIYFYVDDFYYDYVVEFRKKYDPEFKKTTIIRESLDSMYFYKKYFNDESCLMFSPEFRKRVWFKDSADMCYPIYHIINFTKIDFVKRASEVNPYNSDYFFWVDAGGMRESFDQYENVKWPNENSEYFNDKIIHFSHNALFDIHPNKDQYFLSQTRNIQGTAWIVPKNKVDYFFNIIDNQVSTIINEKIVGSDEKVYDFLYNENKEQYQLVVCGWFKFFDVLKISEEELIYQKTIETPKKNLTVIINHFQNDISWVSKLKYPYVIYNKNPNETHLFDINLPNLGFDTIVYLRFIVDNYDNLPDYMCFLQDDPFYHCGNCVEIVNDFDFSKQFYPMSHTYYLGNHEFERTYEYANRINLEYKLPLKMIASCQCIVSKELVLKTSKEMYERIIDTIADTVKSSDNYCIENLWPTILNFNEELIPSCHYCIGYGGPC